MRARRQRRFAEGAVLATRRSACSRSSRPRRRIDDIGETLPVQWRNALLLRVVGDASVEDLPAWILLGNYDEHEPLGREITLAVLARWFDADRPELHPGYTHTAVDAMSLLRKPELLPTLGECLRSEWLEGSARRGVQEEAARAIEGAKRRLFDMLGAEDPVVRSAAARGLAAFGALEAIPSLIDLLADPDAGVQQAAREALDQLQRSGG